MASASGVLTAALEEHGVGLRIALPLLASVARERAYLASAPPAP